LFSTFSYDGLIGDRLTPVALGHPSSVLRR